MGRYVGRFISVGRPADALKCLAVLHYINTCVNVTLFYYPYRYKALQKYLRCLIHAHFIN